MALKHKGDVLWEEKTQRYNSLETKLNMSFGQQSYFNPINNTLMNVTCSKVNEYPWMVGLYTRTSSLPSCGGSLINSKYLSLTTDST